MNGNICKNCQFLRGEIRIKRKKNEQGKINTGVSVRGVGKKKPGVIGRDRKNEAISCQHGEAVSDEVDPSGSL